MRLFLFVIFSALVVGCSSEEKPVNQLLLPKKGFKFQLVQRTQINLPSVDGNVICSINDITKGQTQIIIKENEKVLFADFEIVENIHPKKAEKDETKEIEDLLKKIESSDIIFVRNGEEHTPQEAADHLRSKWEKSGGKIKTKKAFIDHLATKSSMTGELYYVILKDGSKLPAAVWLKESASEE